MMQSCRLRAVCGFPALVLLACAALACSAPKPPRDLILITVDTLRADRLGSYGYDGARTPVIDGLAERGVRFDRAFTTFPRTTPGLASLMTGLLPPHHGSREVAQPMRADVTTLAEYLESAGFVTLGITANSAAGKGQGFGRGFRQLIEPTGPHRKADAVTEQALRLVERDVDPQERLFLWVHYVDPHYPYSPPGPKNPTGAGCRELMQFSNQGRFFAGQVFYNQNGNADAVLDSCSGLYDDEIAFTDAQIGVLLDGLETLRTEADGLVVLTADHGENLGEQGLYYQHGSSLHDASSRVPLIVVAPDLVPRLDEELIGLEDVTPSLLRLLDVETAETDFDGRAQPVRLSRNRWTRRHETAAPEMIVGESGSALVAAAFDHISSGRSGGLHCTNNERFSLCQEPGGPDRLYDHEVDPSFEKDLAAKLPDEVLGLRIVRDAWPAEAPRLRSARDERFKLVEIPRLQGGYRRALYDLETDPSESIDVSADRPLVVERLGAEMDRWTALLPSFGDVEPRDEDTVRELRALGYVD